MDDRISREGHYNSYYKIFHMLKKIGESMSMRRREMEDNQKKKSITELLEMNNIISEMKNIQDRINSRLDTARKDE